MSRALIASTPEPPPTTRESPQQLDIRDVLLVLREVRHSLFRVDHLLAAQRVHVPVERKGVRHPIEGRFAGGEFHLRVAVLVAQQHVRLVGEEENVRCSCRATCRCRSRSCRLRSERDRSGRGHQAASLAEAGGVCLTMNPSSDVSCTPPGELQLHSGFHRPALRDP